MKNPRPSVGARLVALLLKTKKSKRTKYGNLKVHSEEGVFDSQAEYRRWGELRLLEDAGKIVDLKRQVRMPLQVGEIRIGTYIADFVYLAPTDGSLKQVVEDVKGHRTQLYFWKKKHFEAQYGFPITEVIA